MSIQWDKIRLIRKKLITIFVEGIFLEAKVSVITLVIPQARPSI